MMWLRLGGERVQGKDVRNLRDRPLGNTAVAPTRAAPAAARRAALETPRPPEGDAWLLPRRPTPAAAGPSPAVAGGGRRPPASLISGRPLESGAPLLV